MSRFLTVFAILVAINLLGLFGCLFLEDFSPGRAAKRWRSAVAAFSRFLGLVVLSLFYFLVVPFYWLPVKAKDPMGYKASGWTRRKTGDRTLADARRQY